MDENEVVWYETKKYIHSKYCVMFEYMEAHQPHVADWSREHHRLEAGQCLGSSIQRKNLRQNGPPLIPDDVIFAQIPVLD